MSEVNDKKKFVGPISGFPEWLPEERAVELEWLEAIATVYKSYGYTSLETRSVEPLPVLLNQGDTDKEVYGIHRIAADAQAEDEAGLALHYDLTVPFARYTAQNLNSLSFPFKRYQLQKVWRGDRPQGGRFREFYQCDIDVVDRDEVSLFYDYEVAAAALEALSALNLGDLKLRVNNRKMLEGFYKGLGVEDTANVLRIIDKIEKIGDEGVADMLRDEANMTDAAINSCLNLCKISDTNGDIVAQKVRSLGIKHPMLEEGLEELLLLRKNLSDAPANASIELDMSITRGLAYYTGNVFETQMLNAAITASVCSGGRYENLAGSMSNVKLPGVGISIGLSRVISIMKAADLLPKRPQTPTQIMIAYTPGITQQMQIAKSQILRRQGYNVEVYPEPVRLKRQMAYANRKGIPYVYFIGSDGAEDEIRDMKTGAQTLANTWSLSPAQPR
jgi:histidyl-tRNA synthetase